MFLQVNFSSLLAGFLLVLWVSSDEAFAHPAKAARSPDVVTLPIRSVRNMQRSTVHPHIYIGQHINRSNRQLAKMTGRQAPSELERREHLQRRIDHVHAGFAAGQHTHDKRYVVQPEEDKLKIPGAKVGGRLAKALKGKGKKGKGKGKAALAGAAGAAAGAGAATAAGAGDAQPPAVDASATDPAAAPPAATQTADCIASAANSTASANSTSSSGNTSAGVSPLDIQAAQNGGLTGANAPTASNSIALAIDADDNGYIGTVQLGTPPANFNILMDSGSADFWVGGENCQGQQQSGQAGGCGNHTFLGTQSSSSFVDSGTAFQVSYGSGNVAGTIVTDDVLMAGLSLKAHTFGVATQESVQFSDDSIPFDGLMGLAQSTLSQQKVLTPVESLAKAGSIPAAITSFKISRLSDAKNDGQVTFGGLDTTKFDPKTLTTFANVNTQGFWEGAMVPTVNGQSIGLDTGRTGILDTGTTLVIGPTSDVTALHAAINGSAPDGQGGFTVPCTMTDVVTMQFGGTNFDINPSDIAFLPVDVNDPTGTCQSGIQAGQIGGATEWLVGDVFLKNAYFSTDVEKNQISLAKLV